MYFFGEEFIHRKVRETGNHFYLEDLSQETPISLERAIDTLKFYYGLANGNYRTAFDHLRPYLAGKPIT